ncbi:high affinity immunoglobulin gamma Fc receptor I-like [Esox lucius]|uniref:high affinity immunoglobulin gamma Fc receptor I-like n=1 Tax=Esox lucius TaxID=8010 RepID=UPI001477669F|nr:high affinity immunoglobulin gamma Fc receptor I-like [Esox lucius]
MDHIWLCVLPLLSILIYCGHSQDRPVAVLTLQPNWTQIFRGETVTLRCDIQGGGDTDWEYNWNINHNKSEYRISPVDTSHTGSYTCQGVKGKRSSKFSNDLKLHISTDRPKAVLSISPQWMNSGDSVTLNCEVKESSTGWRFSWYKTVPYRAGLPSLLDKPYSVEPLSGYGTTEESYTRSPAGPTDTGGYVCKAGRGDPVYYTDYSEPQFLWSGDLQSSVSLRISPNRTQHFTSKSLSLICDMKGNSTGWRLMRYTETGVESGCSPNWGSITGSTCTITSTDTGDSGVYWCESGSGQYSNAVNITVSVISPGSSKPDLVGVVGLVVAAVLLTIFLVLLSLYKHNKGSSSKNCFWPIHPQSTNQDPQQDQGSTQVQSPDAVYTDSAGVSAADGFSDVTYALIQLKKPGQMKKEQSADPKENSVYSVVNIVKVTASGPIDVTNAQIVHKKVKANKASSIVVAGLLAATVPVPDCTRTQPWTIITHT